MKMEKVLRSALLLLLAAALCLSMAACTQTPAESSPASETQTPETAASEKASTEDDMPEDTGTGETPASDALSSALPVKTLRAKRVDENPYMAKSDANIPTATIPTPRMKFCRSASTRKSTFPMRKPTRTLRLPFTLTATATRSCRCSAASPSAT